MIRQFQTSILCLLMLALTLAQPAAAAGGSVNINTAGIEQLTLLPRVGETVARRIIEFREENGEFKSPADLLLVRGVGEKTFELMAPHVVVKGETTLAEKVTVAGESSDE